jgi:hypothetical protein
MDCTIFLLKASEDLCPNNKGNPTDTTLSNQHVLHNIQLEWEH